MCDERKQTQMIQLNKMCVIHDKHVSNQKMCGKTDNNTDDCSNQAVCCGQTVGSTTKKRHIRDILARTKFFSIILMTIIVTKHGIIIDVVGSYFYEKNHDEKWAFRPGRARDAAA